jgi:toxin ParE1/3/4
VSERRHLVRPKADQDLEDQAYYLATEAYPEVGHSFLVAAHDAFALLATRPAMGWRSRLRHPDLKTLRVFRVSGFEKMLILYRPLPDGVEILRVVHGSRNLPALLRREGLE